MTRPTFAVGDRVATCRDENVAARPGTVIAIQAQGRPFAGEVWVEFDTSEGEAELIHPSNLFHDTGDWP